VPLLPFFGGGGAATLVSGPVPDFHAEDRSRGVSDDVAARAGIVQPVTLRGGEQHTLRFEASRARTNRVGRTAASGLSVRVWFAASEDASTPIGVDDGEEESPLDITLDAVPLPANARIAEYRATIEGDVIQALLVDAGYEAVWRVEEWSTADGVLHEARTWVPVEPA
jgi:hypothetical protein